MPPDIVIYTLAWCPHCTRAKALLNGRGLWFREIDGSGRPDFRSRLVELTGGRTVPQIVIDGTPIGGADQLARLDRSGVLAAVAASEPFPITRLRRRVTPRSLAHAVGARLRGHRRVSPVEHVVVTLDLTGKVVSRTKRSDTTKGVPDDEGVLHSAGGH